MIEWMYFSQLDGRNDFKEKATMRWRAHYVDMVDRHTNWFIDWLIDGLDQWRADAVWLTDIVMITSAVVMS